MPRYINIADDLRDRLARSEWEPGQKIPSIAQLQDQYEVPGLNTIRDAQRILIDEGLLRSEQGVGVFAVRKPHAGADPRGELLRIREAATRALAALDGTTARSADGDSVTFSGLNANSNRGSSVLAMALEEFAEHHQDQQGDSVYHDELSAEANRLLRQLNQWPDGGEAL